jgi:hypothetical protein
MVPMVTSPDFSQVYEQALTHECPVPPAAPAEGGGGTPGGGTPALGATPPTPAITAASLSRTRFAVGPKPTVLSARRHATGTTVRFTLNVAATVTLRFQQRLAGRRVGRTCRKPSRRLRSRPRCSRLVAAGTLRRRLKAGRAGVPFSGRIGRRALKPGSYALTLVATGADGRRSKPVALRFTVLGPRHDPGAGASRAPAA